MSARRRIAPVLIALAACTLAGALPARAEVPAAAKKAMRDASNPVVGLTTSLGNITLELFQKEAPKSTANFLTYVRKKHYDGTIFHRVIPTFMIQGGGLDKDLKEKATLPPIVNESSNGLSNVRGSVAMARLSDPNSATAQFFINVKDNARLDGAKDGKSGYAVFGQVIAGLDVVDKIKAVPTGQKGPHEAVPIIPVTIKAAVQLQ